jgi:hypothetical protein
MVSVPAAAGGDRGKNKLPLYYSSDEDVYVPPADPFDTSIVDNAPEVTS